MAMQFYTSPEQIMRDRSEYARKNISKGRNVVVLSYAGGVLFVAENISPTLHKLSELYDRIGFAAVGRYNEFENLRTAGVRMADLRGYAYDRRDVTPQPLAKAYAQTLGAIFTEQTKPFEVEICVAGVGEEVAGDELYRITYDGSITAAPGYLVMGGQADQLTQVLKESHDAEADLASAFRLALKALGSTGGENGQRRIADAALLEVAVLERDREGRAFRRIIGAALTALMPAPQEPEADEPSKDDEGDADTDDAAVDAVIDELAGDEDAAEPPRAEEKESDGDGESGKNGS